MNYGPTAKQLEEISKQPRVFALPTETEDTAGWFEDGQRDAAKGRKCDYGSCSLVANQNAYLAGYASYAPLTKE